MRLQLAAARISQARADFLPLGPKLLKSLKTSPWSSSHQTLGEHLKKRRMELSLLQRDLRACFKLEKETYANWEKDRCTPAMQHWPGIIEFLGFDPNPKPSTFGERLTAYRRCQGLSRKALAACLAVDEATVWRWEMGQKKSENQKHCEAIQRLQISEFNSTEKSATGGHLGKQLWTLQSLASKEIDK